MLVKCSAVFSTSGTSIKPMKLSGTCCSVTMNSISSTRKTEMSAMSAMLITIANIASKNVNFFFARSRCLSASACSSASRTSAKIESCVLALNHKYSGETGHKYYRRAARNFKDVLLQFFHREVLSASFVFTTSDGGARERRVEC